jgi:hypothetical protein
MNMSKRPKREKNTLTKPQAPKPEPMKAEAAKPQAVKPEPARPQPVKLQAVQPEATRLDVVKPEPAKSEPARPKTSHVCLEFVKPDAKTVCVAGSFNEWKPEKTPLAPLGNGRWAGDVKVRPGRHEYLFVVDGQWLPDPQAKETVQNPFGGRNSVLVVSE